MRESHPMENSLTKKSIADPIRDIMFSEVPIAQEQSTVGDILSMLKKKSHFFKTINYIYINNSRSQLVGVLSIRTLFGSPKKTLVKDIMQTKIFTVSPHIEVEKIAHLALKHNLKAVPVVQSRKLLGVVPPHKIISILNRSLSKDILHFAGIHSSHLQYENSLEVPLFQSVLHRVPWLIFGLAGIIIVAAFIGFFEHVLSKNLILAFFIPSIVYMSDAVGTQHQTLFVRDLAIMGKKLKIPQYFMREGKIALLIGFCIGLVMFFAISLFWKQPYIAFVIAIASVASIIITSFTSLMITLLLQRAGSDPALGSGPLATIISDTTSIFVYFAVASFLL